MHSCRLIVCEKTSHWAAALRACLGGRPPRIVETRSLVNCEDALSQSPAGVVALETTPANLDAVLSFIASINNRFPRVSIVVLLTADAASAAALLREAGAIDAVASVLELPRVMRLARRKLRQTAGEPLSLHQFVAERLPWPAHATESAAR